MGRISLTDMEIGWQKRNTRRLWLLILSAIFYGAALHVLHTLTGHVLWDGIIGIVLGL